MKHTMTAVHLGKDKQINNTSVEATADDLYALGPPKLTMMKPSFIPF